MIASLEAAIWHHYRTENLRTPIMFDDGIMAYVLTGVASRINAGI